MCGLIARCVPPDMAIVKRLWHRLFTDWFVLMISITIIIIIIISFIVLSIFWQTRCSVGKIKSLTSFLIPQLKEDRACLCGFILKLPRYIYCAPEAQPRFKFSILFVFVSASVFASVFVFIARLMFILDFEILCLWTLSFLLKEDSWISYFWWRNG